MLVGAVNPPRVAYGTRDALVAFYDRLLERASALPGVETAALPPSLPLGGDSDMTILLEGRPAPRTEADSAAVWYRLVSREYFGAVGIRDCGGPQLRAARSGAGRRRQRRHRAAAVER